MPKTAAGSAKGRPGTLFHSDRRDPSAPELRPLQGDGPGGADDCAGDVRFHGADRGAAPARYVTNFLYEEYVCDAGLKRDVLVGSGEPQYSMLTAPDVKAIVIEFAGAK